MAYTDGMRVVLGFVVGSATVAFVLVLFVNLLGMERLREQFLPIGGLLTALGGLAGVHLATRTTKRRKRSSRRHPLSPDPPE